MDALGDGWLAYPRDVRELGGTTNRIGQLWRELGREDFLHIELSHALRQRLVGDRGARGEMLACLGGGGR